MVGKNNRLVEGILALMMLVMLSSSVTADPHTEFLPLHGYALINDTFYTGERNFTFDFTDIGSGNIIIEQNMTLNVTSYGLWFTTINNTNMTGDFVNSTSLTIYLEGMLLTPTTELGYVTHAFYAKRANQSTYWGEYKNVTDILPYITINYSNVSNAPLNLSEFINDLFNFSDYYNKTETNTLFNFTNSINALWLGINASNSTALISGIAWRENATYNALNLTFRNTTTWTFFWLDNSSVGGNTTAEMIAGVNTTGLLINWSVGSVDLSNYYNKTEIDALLANKSNGTFLEEGLNIDIYDYGNGTIQVNTSRNLTIDYLLSDLLPDITLTRDLGSGANRWSSLWVQNISAEYMGIFNLVASENITADYYIGNGTLLTGVCLSDGTNCQNTTASQVNGSGTAGYIPRWISSSELGDSYLQQGVSEINITGAYPFRFQSYAYLFSDGNTFDIASILPIQLKQGLSTVAVINTSGGFIFNSQICTASNGFCNGTGNTTQQIITAVNSTGLLINWSVGSVDLSNYYNKTETNTLFNFTSSINALWLGINASNSTDIIGITAWRENVSYDGINFTYRNNSVTTIFLFDNNTGGGADGVGMTIFFVNQSGIMRNITNASTFNETNWNASGYIKNWNASGYIKNWNASGYIKNWNASGYIKNWNASGYIRNWGLDDFWNRTGTTLTQKYFGDMINTSGNITSINDLALSSGSGKAYIHSAGTLIGSKGTFPQDVLHNYISGGIFAGSVASGGITIQNSGTAGATPHLRLVGGTSSTPIIMFGDEGNFGESSISYETATGDFNIINAIGDIDILIDADDKEMYIEQDTSDSTGVNTLLRINTDTSSGSPTAGLGWALRGEVDGSSVADIQFKRSTLSNDGQIVFNLFDGGSATNLMRLDGEYHSVAISEDGSAGLNNMLGTLYVHLNENATSKSAVEYLHQDHDTGATSVEYLKQDDEDVHFTTYDGTKSDVCGANIVEDGGLPMMPTMYYIKIDSPDLPQDDGHGTTHEYYYQVWVCDIRAK